MSNQHHTPGPWAAIGTSVRQVINGVASLVEIANLFHSGVSLSEAEANARRIVACVNACDGIETDALETPGIIQQRIESACGELYEVKRQRDELLAAMRQTRLWVIESAASVETQAAQIAIIDAAIAKATT